MGLKRIYLRTVNQELNQDLDSGTSSFASPAGMWELILLTFTVVLGFVVFYLFQSILSPSASVSSCIYSEIYSMLSWALLGICNLCRW